MKFKLPKLNTTVDCEAIGYPGLTVTAWLNTTQPDEPYHPPENGEPWETPYWQSMARVLMSMHVPGEFTESGEAQTIEPLDAKTLFEMWDSPGFETGIITHVLARLQAERAKRLQAELGN